MKDIQFPLFKTRVEGLNRKFNLIDPAGRKEYFEAKAGPEIQKLQQYLKTNSFVAYLLGKKSAGKGTYSKMFGEVVGPERIFHFSIGDMIRGIDKELANEQSKKELISFLEKNYRGWTPLDKIMSALEQRSTKTLLPTELILALVKREIEKQEKKAIFIDGFPRNLDQVSFSLFFRDLIGYRDDSDIFILIDVPESVIDERIKHRRVCPVCQTSRNLRTLPTDRVGYDEQKKEYYLFCDNPNCRDSRMVQKEGDELGIETIRERLTTDEEIIKGAFGLYGIPKILLRNSVPVAEAEKYIDDYEITPAYEYSWASEDKKVRVIEKPWEVLDDQGINSFSLLPPPVVVSLIKQMTDIL